MGDPVDLDELGRAVRGRDEAVGAIADDADPAGIVVDHVEIGIDRGRAGAGGGDARKRWGPIRGTVTL